MVEKGSRIAGEILYYLSKDWISSNLKYEQDKVAEQFYDMFSEKNNNLSK